MFTSIYPQLLLTDQGKEIEENNRMEKTRDLFKKKDTKGTFHVKMDTIKDRNGMDLTEAEPIKRWQESMADSCQCVTRPTAVLWSD